MSNNIDPFELARNNAELVPDELTLLEAYRLLPPEKAAAATGLMRWFAGLEKGDDPIPEPPPPARQPRNKFDTDRLRAAAEELAAAYQAPLPEGDAGLVAAVQRWRDLQPLHHFNERGFDYTLKDENEIITPISNKAESEFEDKIEEWPPVGLVGVAAKLRYLLQRSEMGCAIDLDEVAGEQLIAVIERAIAKGAAP
jgi:hypothetical protein